jgi:hypothetical protein
LKKDFKFYSEITDFCFINDINLNYKLFLYFFRKKSLNIGYFDYLKLKISGCDNGDMNIYESGNYEIVKKYKNIYIKENEMNDIINLINIFENEKKLYDPHLKFNINKLSINSFEETDIKEMIIYNKNIYLKKKCQINDNVNLITNYQFIVCFEKDKIPNPTKIPISNGDISYDVYNNFILPKTHKVNKNNYIPYMYSKTYQILPFNYFETMSYTTFEILDLNNNSEIIGFFEIKDFLINEINKTIYKNIQFGIELRNTLNNQFDKNLNIIMNIIVETNNKRITNLIAIKLYTEILEMRVKGFLLV